MIIQINKKDRQFIKSTLETMLPSARFYLFGSRAKGTAKPASDCDIVIVSENSIPLLTLSKLKEIFIESHLAFKVDIIDWQRIDDEFRRAIKPDWVPL